MAIDLNYYLKYTRANEIASQTDIQEMSDAYSSQYNLAISKFDVLINSNRADIIYRDNIPYNCIIDYGISNTKQTTLIDQNIREIWTTHSDGFKVGDFIQLENKISKEKEPYIFVNHQETKEGYDLGVVQKTNNILKFFSNQTQLLYEIPCIVGDVNIGNSETKYITTIDNSLKLNIPNNEITRQIKPDQIYKIGMYNYKIISLSDDISIPGLLIFKMDYSATEQTLPVFTVSILNSEPLSTNMITPIQLNVEVLKDNVNLSPTPPLIFTSSDNTIATVSSTGLIQPVSIGNVTIAVQLESNQMVTDSISIDIVEVPIVETYYLELTGATIPDTEIKQGQTSTFTCVKKNNSGVIVDGAIFDFTIDPEITPADKYTFTVLNDTQCTIKCNSSVYYINLIATDRADNTLTISKRIKLRALF